MSVFEIVNSNEAEFLDNQFNLVNETAMLEYRLLENYEDFALLIGGFETRPFEEVLHERK